MVCEEDQYLNLIRAILHEGYNKNDRTGVGTLSVFGVQMRFNLRDQFPMITTKQIFWRGVVEELLWIIRGSTNAKELSDKNVNIWNGNSSREYLDNLGFFDRTEGDLGPVYGFQWRHFGAKYKTSGDNYKGQGIDQLRQVIDKLLNNPHDRRIIICSWNPADLSNMALPPCHCFVQFYANDNELSCQLYQRSADVGLGVPFNIVSYALLTYIISQAVGMTPGTFVHTLGDAHIYKTHINGLKEQVARTPHHFPRVRLKKDLRSTTVEGILSNIESLTFEDFELTNYVFHPKILLPFSA